MDVRPRQICTENQDAPTQEATLLNPDPAREIPAAAPPELRHLEQGMPAQKDLRNSGQPQ